MAEPVELSFNADSARDAASNMAPLMDAMEKWGRMEQQQSAWLDQQVKKVKEWGTGLSKIPETIHKVVDAHKKLDAQLKQMGSSYSARKFSAFKEDAETLLKANTLMRSLASGTGEIIEAATQGEFGGIYHTISDMLEMTYRAATSRIAVAGGGGGDGGDAMDAASGEAATQIDKFALVVAGATVTIGLFVMALKLMNERVNEFTEIFALKGGSLASAGQAVGIGQVLGLSPQELAGAMSSLQASLQQNPGWGAMLGLSPKDIFAGNAWMGQGFDQSGAFVKAFDVLTDPRKSTAWLQKQINLSQGGLDPIAKDLMQFRLIRQYHPEFYEKMAKEAPQQFSEKQMADAAMREKQFQLAANTFDQTITDLGLKILPKVTTAVRFLTDHLTELAFTLGVVGAVVGAVKLAKFGKGIISDTKDLLGMAGKAVPQVMATEVMNVTAQIVNVNGGLGGNAGAGAGEDAAEGGAGALSAEEAAGAFTGAETATGTAAGVTGAVEGGAAGVGALAIAGFTAAVAATMAGTVWALDTFTGAKKFREDNAKYMKDLNAHQTAVNQQAEATERGARHTAYVQALEAHTKALIYHGKAMNSVATQMANQTLQPGSYGASGTGPRILAGWGPGNFNTSMKGQAIAMGAMVAG